MDPNQAIGPLPWYVAVLWGVIAVVGTYCVLLLLAWLFPRSWGRINRKRLEPFRRMDSKKRGRSVSSGAEKVNSNH